MNRTIKFRGKRTDNGEWVFGSFISLHPDCTEIFYIEDFSKKGVKTNCVYVISETVGQFTELCDKNRKEICEGDIVKYYKSNGKTYIGKIVYNKNRVSFEVSIPNVGKFSFYTALGENCQSVEIIGNIHDNKYLLTQNNHEQRY